MFRQGGREWVIVGVMCVCGWCLCVCVLCGIDVRMCICVRACVAHCDSIVGYCWNISFCQILLNVHTTPSSSTSLLQAQKTAAEDVMPVLAGAVDPVHALPMLVHTLAAEEHPRVLAPMKMISLVSRPVCVCVHILHSSCVVHTYIPTGFTEYTHPTSHVRSRDLFFRLYYIHMYYLHVVGLHKLITHRCLVCFCCPVLLLPLQPLAPCVSVQALSGIIVACSKGLIQICVLFAVL